MRYTMAEKTRNGKIVINRLNSRSGPKSDFRITDAVFESQNGQACAAKDSRRKGMINKDFIVTKH
jgi:hypothetical protein